MVPYLVASMLLSVPESLHQNIVDALCYSILPFTVGAPSLDDNENYAGASLPPILMIVFQYTDKSVYHSQLVECVMALKKDVIKDLFTVIAYGTPKARAAAANLLFFYWPNFNPTLFERKSCHIKFTGNLTVFHDFSSEGWVVGFFILLIHETVLNDKDK
ncbi:hypothetical protein Avbf_03315 [Armadillidium vulgare]|nr:hypothetical protein Avbf_03315 [Armadillidium vulgare]